MVKNYYILSLKNLLFILALLTAAIESINNFISLALLIINAKIVVI